MRHAGRFAGVCAAALLIVPAASLAQRGGAAFDTPPDFAIPPTNMQLQSAYPVAARATGADGHVTIDCIVTTTGGLRSCSVISEDPPGLSFGQAALVLAPQLMMKPATKDGKAVESRMRTRIFFPGAPQRTGTNLPGAREPLKGQLIAKIVWRAAPSYDDLIAVYPERAKAAKTGGRAVLDCTLGAEGKLRRCSAVSENPGGQRFGEAARRLMDRFTGPARFADGASTEGVGTQIAVTFNPKMLERRDAISPPRWMETPSLAEMNAVFPEKAKAAGVRQSRAVMECGITAEGGLSDCRVQSEAPEGLGFGEAALKVAPLFKMPVWAEDGSPVAGATIRLPLRYDIPGSGGR